MKKYRAFAEAYQAVFDEQGLRQGNKVLGRFQTAFEAHDEATAHTLGVLWSQGLLGQAQGAAALLTLQPVFVRLVEIGEIP